MKKEKNKNATLIETYERYDIGGAGELDLGGQSPRVDPPPVLTVFVCPLYGPPPTSGVSGY